MAPATRVPIPAVMIPKQRCRLLVMTHSAFFAGDPVFATRRRAWLLPVRNSSDRKPARLPDVSRNVQRYSRRSGGIVEEWTGTPNSEFRVRPRPRWDPESDTAPDLPTSRAGVGRQEQQREKNQEQNEGRQGPLVSCRIQLRRESTGRGQERERRIGQILSTAAAQSGVCSDYARPPLKRDASLLDAPIPP